MNNITVRYSEYNDGKLIPQETKDIISGFANSYSVPSPAEIAKHNNVMKYCYVLVSRHGVPDFMGDDDICTVSDFCDIFETWKDMTLFIKKYEPSMFAAFSVHGDSANRWDYEDHNLQTKSQNNI